MLRSLKWRLAVIFFTVSSAFLFCMSLYLLNSMGKYAEDQVEARLSSYLSLLAEDFSGNEGQQDFQSYAEKTGDRFKVNVTIMNTDGTVLGDSARDSQGIENNLQRPEVQMAMGGETGKSIRSSAFFNQKMLFLAQPVRRQNQIVGIVRVAVPWREVAAGQNSLRWRVGLITLIALILNAMVISFVTSRLVKPLREMTRAARRMGQGKLDAGLQISSEDEIGDLSRALNNTAERLKDNFSQLTEEKNKIKAILSSMTDGVIALDRSGNILFLNRSFEKTFHIQEAVCLGKSVIETVRNFELDRLMHSALTTGEPTVRELQILAPEAQTFRVSTAPLTNEAGLVGVVAVIRDITAFREVERMKADFVANVSHELRTPLTSIKGFVETLLDGALGDPRTARHFLDIVNEEADRLNRLINDLLSLSQIEAKQKEIHKVPVNFEKMITGAVSVLAPQAAEKNIRLNLELQQPLPEIMADEDMMGQLLINLVDNAIKYTLEGGTVTVSARCREKNLEVKVADTGIGIPKDSIPRLFERFYRVDKARSREMGGTGLGLAIVKHILEVHAGSIRVDSLVGRGSTFTVGLPEGGGEGGPD